MVLTPMRIGDRMKHQTSVCFKLPDGPQRLEAFFVDRSPESDPVLNRPER